MNWWDGMVFGSMCFALAGLVLLGLVASSLSEERYRFVECAELCGGSFEVTRQACVCGG